MRNLMMSTLFMAAMSLLVWQRGYGQELATVQDESLTIFVHAVESGPSFPAYVGDTLANVTAGKGSILVQVECVVKNDSRTAKQPFRLGNVKLKGANMKYELIAVGYPSAIAKPDRDKTDNRIENADPNTYVFYKYVFEVPAGGTSWELCYKGKPLVELKGKAKPQH
jgi:hypothetical protein